METVSPLFAVIRRLRGENGCEWDQKQTPDSMWKCLVEETYELEEAIVKDDTDNIVEELGDVLFQILFIAEMYNEAGRFCFSDVVENVAEKMIRRHPHVYGDARVNSEEELNRQWDAIKSKEKNHTTGRKSSLDGVPHGMPGLLRALKVSKSAVKAGFDWENMAQVLETVQSEIKEFESAVEKGDPQEMMMEFGDILFSLVNVARFGGFHPETALYHSTVKFEGRFRKMEDSLGRQGLDLKSLTSEEKDKHWQTAKKDYDR